MSFGLQSLQTVPAVRSGPAPQTIPLFPGLPGGPEMIILLLVVLIGVAPALFVYYDAKRNRVPHRLAWTLGTLLAGFFGTLVGSGVVVLLYVVVARR